MNSKIYSMISCGVLACVFLLIGNYNIANIYIAAILILSGVTDKETS